MSSTQSMLSQSRGLAVLLALYCGGTIALAQQSGVPAKRELVVAGETTETLSLGARMNDGWRFGSRDVFDRDLVRYGRPAPLKGPLALLLRDGSKLAASGVRFNGSDVMLDSATLSTVRLAKNAVACVLFRLEPPGAEREKDWSRRIETSQNGPDQAVRNGDAVQASEPFEDHLELATGDRLSAAVMEVTARHIRYKINGNEVETPLEAIRAWRPAINTKKQAANPNTIWLGLSDGSLLNCSIITPRATSSEGGLEPSVDVANDGFLAATANLSDIVFIQPLLTEQTVVFLSDAPPVEHRQFPLFTRPWPLGMDTDMEQAPIISGGILWLKGLGVHASNRIVVKRPPNKTKFKALIGLLDSAQGQGSVRFLVYISRATDYQKQPNWRMAFQSAVMRGSDLPVEVAVDLDEAQWAALVVSDADGSDVLDRAAWLEARWE